MTVVLDTSALIAGRKPSRGGRAAISTVSIAELHFGLLVAKGTAQRASRLRALGRIEARFPDPVAVTDEIAREWGRLQAEVALRGGQPRRRLADLAIAATANVLGAELLTADRDFEIIADLVRLTQ